MRKFPEKYDGLDGLNTDEDDGLDGLNTDENDELDGLNMDENDELKKIMEDVGIQYEPTQYIGTEEEEMLEF